MNKILVYSVLAILLGTVTMFVPLYVLEQRDTIPERPYTIDVPDSEPSQEDRGIENGESFEANDILDGPETPAPQPTPGDSSSSIISSIGLMIVPSFLIALGAFVYLKRRIA